MLNMSVAPQIKSPADTVAGLVNSDFSDSKEPAAAEEFGKILEREVSEVANEPHSAADKQNKDTDQQSENVAVTLPIESASTQADDASPGSVTSLVQTILNDTASAYKIDASLMPDTSVINTPITAVSSIAAMIQQQSALVSQNNESLPSSALPMANQLLQQKLMQQNLEESNLTSLSDNLLQSIELEKSAAYDKVLPLIVESNDTLQRNFGDLFVSMPDKVDSVQSFGLNNAITSSTLADTTMTEKVNVSTPVGHARWGEELAQKVVWMTSQQTQVAEIHLNPAHLGPVEVMLSISQDQATAQFVSQHPAVRDAIQDALPRLREMLAESGIQLGNVMVGADSFQQENKQQQAQQFNKNTVSVTDSPAEAATASVEIATVSSRHHGLVNTYA